MNEPRLEISIRTSSAQQARRIQLNRRTVSVGSFLSNDIVLSGGEIAGEHCEFEIQDRPNNIILRQKNGKIRGSHGAIVPDGEQLEFGTVVYFGTTEFFINRLDIPQDVEDEEGTFPQDSNSSQNDNLLKEETTSNSQANYQDDAFVDDSDIFGENTQGKQNVIGDVTSFRSDFLERQKAYEENFDEDRTFRHDVVRETKRSQSKITSKASIIFLAGLILLLGIGGIGSYLLNGSSAVSDSKSVVASMESMKPMETSDTPDVDIEDRIRAILTENGFENISVILENGRYRLTGYAKTNADVMRARQRIDDVINTRVIYNLYSDDVIRASVEALLLAMKEDITISSLVYGQVKLAGTVPSDTSVSNLKEMLQQDISALRSVDVADIRVVDTTMEQVVEKEFKDRILGVWLGENPVIKMDNGRRYAVGDTIEDGRVIMSISEDEIILINDDEMEIMPLRG
jgi:hypothetical protein